MLEIRTMYHVEKFLPPERPHCESSVWGPRIDSALTGTASAMLRRWSHGTGSAWLADCRSVNSLAPMAPICGKG
jgi:hypothetical protein